MKKSRKRLTAAMAILCCLSLLVSSFAFFTDRLTANTGGTAGNLDLVFTDISSSKTGANEIVSPNSYAIDKSWEHTSLISDGGVINPGDYFDLSYTVSNEGNKSMDVRQQLTLTSDKELTEGAEEYKLTIIGDHNDTTTVTGELQDDKKTIIYDLSDITLNGIGTGAETETGITISEETYIIRLDFGKNAGNAFMDSNVAVNYKAQAKQHRNTNDSHWVTWAEFETSYGEIASSGNKEVIAYNGDPTGLPSVSNTEDEVAYYQFSDMALTADALQNYSLTATSPATPMIRSFALTPSDIPYSENFKLSESEGTLSTYSEDATVILDGVVVATTADNVSVDEMTFPTAGLYVSRDFAEYSLELTEETIESVKLSYENNQVGLGYTANPSLVLTPADYSGSVSVHYEVLSGEEFVSVNAETGVITGLAEGSATILVTVTDATDNSVTSRCTVECKPPVAFAIYSKDDYSLTFYKNADYESVAVGESYKDKTVTSVYTGFEEDVYVKTTYYQTSTAPWNNIKQSVKSVTVADPISPASLNYWFYLFDNCTSMNLEKLDTSSTTSMMFTFDSCTSLTELDLSNFDTSNATTLSGMFYMCSGLTELDVSHFVTNKVIDMSHMFYGLNFANLDLSSWDVSSVEDMSYMFVGFGKEDAFVRINLSNWNTAALTDMEYMFHNCARRSSGIEIIGINGLDTSEVTNMKGTFLCFGYEATEVILDLSSWDTAKVEDMRSMFMQIGYEAETVKLNLSNWKPICVYSMERMFTEAGYNAITFELVGLENWKTSNVTSMSLMFDGAGYNASYTLDLRNWNVSRVSYSTAFNRNVTSKILAPKFR